MKINIFFAMLMTAHAAYADDVAPLTMIEISRQGIMLPVAGIVVDTEVDVPVLDSNGNILHLLGTAHPVKLPDGPFVEVDADLAGTTQKECTAHVQNLVAVTTHHTVAQKLDMTCLGVTIHDAFVKGER